MDNRAVFFCKLIKNVIHPDTPIHSNEKVDWTYLTQLAKGHNLLPLFMEGAIEYTSYAERPEHGKEMQDTLAIVAAQVKRTKAFLKLYEAFIQADIHPLVMKGLICRQLYGKLCDHRPSGDEDILICPKEYWKAKDVLVANGYEPKLQADTEKRLEELQEVSFVHSKEKLHIELHLNAIGKENDTRIRMNDCFKNVFSNYREVSIQGINVRTMNHSDHLLFLVLHAFKHFMDNGLGIRQLLDILLYCEQYGAEIDFEKMYQVLRKLKAIDFWSDILHVGNLYFGFALQAPQGPICPEELLENVIESGTFGGRNDAEKIAANAVRSVKEVSSKNKCNQPLVLVWKAIFPSKEYMLLHATYLAEKPWLLPIAWIRRWKRFLIRNKKHDGNLALESVKNSQRRIQILKKYDLI